MSALEKPSRIWWQVLGADNKNRSTHKAVSVQSLYQMSLSLVKRQTRSWGELSQQNQGGSCLPSNQTQPKVDMISFKNTVGM